MSTVQQKFAEKLQHFNLRSITSNVNTTFIYTWKPTEFCQTHVILTIGVKVSSIPNFCANVSQNLYSQILNFVLGCGRTAIAYPTSHRKRDVTCVLLTSSVPHLLPRIKITLINDCSNAITILFHFLVTFCVNTKCLWVACHNEHARQE